MKRGGYLKRTPFKRSVKKSILRRSKPRKPKDSVSALKKRLDAVFSLYIRSRDAGQCFTCPTKRSVKEMQNGHYISRVHNNTRYDETNCNTQCPGCNIFKSGNMAVYALNLIQKYGPNILQELDAKRRVIKQFTKQELQELIAKYGG